MEKQHVLIGFSMKRFYHICYHFQIMQTSDMLKKGLCREKGSKKEAEE
ncbi:MAG: hypothetical protein HFE86_03480 [Clostridiales bacterium]|nr:hypothetical protein [Clostridiales bacterium]